MQRKVKLNGRKLVFRSMHIELGLCDIIQAINGCPCIELGLCDITQPKMAALHCFQLSTIQTSETLIFHSFLITFMTDCMFNKGFHF